MRFTGTVKELLVSIQQSIDARVSGIVDVQRSWPCRAGCDRCCRHLAAIPEITAPEWALMSAGRHALPEAVQRAVTERMRALEDATYPFTCPLLDTPSGLCLVYEHRPLACRTYGFYVEHGIALYCEEIRAPADAGRLDDVVWGNQATVDDRSVGLGVKRSLIDWLKLGSDAG